MTLTLRDLKGMAEFHLAQALQYAVWGADDLADPGDLMMVIQAEGGLVAGAFDDGTLVGYVFAFPTRDPEVQHSHRLAVLPGARGRGIGLALKWYQRDWCLQRGIGLVRWTFDPLRHTNASLNIARLGARVSTYCPDYYGPMEGINQGTPSDRLRADWWLKAPHVARLARGRGPDALPGAVRVAIPADFGALLATDPAAALAERLRVRAEMTAHLAAGHEVRGYDAAARAYLLMPA